MTSRCAVMMRNARDGATRPRSTPSLLHVVVSTLLQRQLPTASMIPATGGTPFRAPRRGEAGAQRLDFGGQRQSNRERAAPRRLRPMQREGANARPGDSEDRRMEGEFREQQSPEAKLAWLRNELRACAFSSGRATTQAESMRVEAGGSPHLRVVILNVRGVMVSLRLLFSWCEQATRDRIAGPQRESVGAHASCRRRSFRQGTYFESTAPLTLSDFHGANRLQKPHAALAGEACGVGEGVAICRHQPGEPRFLLAAVPCHRYGRR